MSVDMEGPSTTMGSFLPLTEQMEIRPNMEDNSKEASQQTHAGDMTHGIEEPTYGDKEGMVN